MKGEVLFNCNPTTGKAQMDLFRADATGSERVLGMDVPGTRYHPQSDVGWVIVDW